MMEINNVYTQNNLVENPRFEDRNPSNRVVYLFLPLNSCNPWLLTSKWVFDGYWWDSNRANISPNEGTPDLFGKESIECDNKSAQVWTNATPYENYYGKQASKHWCEDGKPGTSYKQYSYAGVGYCFTYNRDNRLASYTEYNYQSAEYLSQKLDSALKPGNFYRLKFKISRPELLNDWVGLFPSEYWPPIDISLKYFGALFTDESNKISEQYVSPIHYSYWDGIKVLNMKPLDKTGHYPKDNTYCHWMEVEGFFQACDDYRYMYIGHFNPDIRLESDTFECNKEHVYQSYYYITDVELYDVTDSIETICGNYNWMINYCNDNCDFKIITHPSRNPSADTTICDDSQCCREIFIKREGNCEDSIKFNFARIIVEYDDYDDVMLVPVSQQNYQRFLSGDSIHVYTLCHKYPETGAYLEFDVKIKLFNSVDSMKTGQLCYLYPGWWSEEETLLGERDSCDCPCEVKQNPLIFSFEPAAEEGDSCCYKLTLRNNNNCNWMIKGIKATIGILEGGGYTYLNDTTDNDLSFTNYLRWTKRIPFPDSTNNYNWDYLPFPPNKFYLAPGDTTTVARICIPQNGRQYRFIFSDNSFGMSDPSIPFCNINFLKQCYPDLSPECCDSVSVTAQIVGYPPDCCYYLFIKPSEALNCPTVYFNVFDFNSDGSIYHQIENEVNYDSYIEVDTLLGRKFGPYCINLTGRDSIKVDLYFNEDSTATYCQKIIEVDCPAMRCCDSTSVTITNQGLYDDGEFCYYILEVRLDSILACDSMKIVVRDTSSFKIFNMDTTFKIISGITRDTIGVNKTDFNGDSVLNVIVEFKNKNGVNVCEKYATLIACSNLPYSCTPDFTDFHWKEPADTIKDLVLICPIEPYDTCKITCTYTYRHVRDSNDNSLHRDIQVLKWEMDCNCDIKNFAGDIISQIWDKDEVKQVFGVDTSSITPGDTICFMNFRVITSDCWAIVIEGGPDPWTISKRSYRCNDSVCCYQTYKVCYWRNPSDLKMYFDSFTRLDSLPPTPDQCDPPCHPDNCNIWDPFGSVHPAHGRVPIDSDKYLTNVGCSIVFRSNNEENLLDIFLRCTEEGTVSINIFDMLGSLVSHGEYRKKSYEMSIKYNLNLNSGLYLCTVKLNDRVFDNKKFIIIK